MSRLAEWNQIRVAVVVPIFICVLHDVITENSGFFSTCWAIYERFSGYRPYSTIIFDFVMNFKCKPVLFLCTSASLNIKVNGRSLLSESDVRVIIKANVRSYHDHHELTFEIYKKKIAKLQKLFFGETFPDKKLCHSTGCVIWHDCLPYWNIYAENITGANFSLFIFEWVANRASHSFIKMKPEALSL